MATLSADELLDAFVADGNRLVGPRPSRCIGSFQLKWRGGGSEIFLQDGVTLSSITMAFQNGGGSIRIEAGATAKGRMEVSEEGRIRIGAGTFLNRICDIRAGEGASVDIGSNCLFSDVKVQTSDMHSILHAASGRRTNPAAGIVIEDNVWIAEEVRVSKGVRIGTGAVIAAGSLVTRPIAPFCLAGGRPAKILRTGVRWSRKLEPLPPQPAPEFSPKDIPLDKEVLRYLVSAEKFALVEAVISAADQSKLPLYARWYLVFTRYQLGIPHPEAIDMLKQVLKEAPNHGAARALLNELH